MVKWSRALTVVAVTGLVVVVGPVGPAAGQQSAPGAPACRSWSRPDVQRDVYDLGGGRYRVRLIQGQLSAFESVRDPDSYVPLPSDDRFTVVTETVLPEFTLVPGSARATEGATAGTDPSGNTRFTPLFHPAGLDTVSVTDATVEWHTDQGPVAGSRPSDYAGRSQAAAAAASVLEYDLQLRSGLVGTLAPVTGAQLQFQQLTIFFPIELVVPDLLVPQPSPVCTLTVDRPTLRLTAEPFGDPGLTRPITAPVPAGSTAYLRLSLRNDGPFALEVTVHTPDTVLDLTPLPTAAAAETTRAAPESTVVAAAAVRTLRGTTGVLRADTSFQLTATAPIQVSTVTGSATAIPTTVANQLTSAVVTAATQTSVAILAAPPSSTPTQTPTAVGSRRWPAALPATGATAGPTAAAGLAAVAVGVLLLICLALAQRRPAVEPQPRPR